MRVAFSSLALLLATTAGCRTADSTATVKDVGNGGSGGGETQLMVCTLTKGKDSTNNAARLSIGNGAGEAARVRVLLSDAVAEAVVQQYASGKLDVVLNVEATVYDGGGEADSTYQAQGSLPAWPLHEVSGDIRKTVTASVTDPAGHILATSTCLLYAQADQ